MKLKPPSSAPLPWCREDDAIFDANGRHVAYIGVGVRGRDRTKITGLIDWIVAAANATQEQPNEPTD